MSGDRYKIVDQNVPYFLTFTVIDWVDVFSNADYKMELVDSMNFCTQQKGLTVYGWVIMSNHMHAIWQAKDGFYLSSIIRDFKKHTAKQIIQVIEGGTDGRKKWMLNKFAFAGRRLNRISKYKFWQDRNHAIQLEPQNTIIIQQKLDYIHNNPVKAMYVNSPEDYVFSSAIDYTGGKGLVQITKV